MSDIELMPVSEPVRRFEVFTGAGRRRRWPDEVKARIVAESYRPGVSVSAVARRHGLTAQQLFTWRRRARRGLLRSAGDEPLFAAVVAAPEGSTGPGAVRSTEMVIEVADLRLRIGDGVAPERAAAVVAALRGVR